MRLAGARFAGWTAAILLSLAIYWPTFSITWAYDDVDYINVASRMLSGELPFWRGVFEPQGEHITAGLRLTLFSYLGIIGIDAFAFRVFIAIVHALSGIFLGVIARHTSGSTRAGIVTSLVYVGACGFSSMWIWQPNGSTVPLSLAMITGAAALLTRRDRLLARRAAACVLILAALLTESAFAPMTLLPAVIDEFERYRSGRRRPGTLTIFTILAIAAVALIVPRYLGNIGVGMSINIAQGLPRAAFLLFIAPIRLFVPATHIIAWYLGLKVTELAIIVGVILALTVPLLLFRLWRKRVPSLAIVAALSAIGPIGVLLLVGLGRWRSTYWELYDADRYFFPLLIPIALLAGAIASSISIRNKFIFAAVIVFLAGELALHRWAMLARIPFDVYGQHAARFEKLSRVVDALDREALTIPNNSLYFAEVHNGRIGAAVLTHILSDGSLRPGGPRVDDATAARINVVFAKHDPDLRVIDGRLVNTKFVTTANALQCGESVILMISSDDLTLRLAGVAHETLPLGITATDIQRSVTIPLGTVDVSGEDERTDTLSARPYTTKFGHGRRTRLTLECDRVRIISLEASPHS
ncbi:MAG TPA: hypothetical protein VGQ76_10505 [Thermoanaerobaculia bacterium]|nr:hypothetical protein [Thermoanaerobaculia bacterium]